MKNYTVIWSAAAAVVTGLTVFYLVREPKIVPLNTEPVNRETVVRADPEQIQTARRVEPAPEEARKPDAATEEAIVPNLKVAEHINASRLGMLADLDDVYAPFYRRLKFTPEKFKELRRIMAERQSLPFVVSASLQSQGITDPVLSEQILNEQRWLFDEKLRGMLSPQEYDAFVDFDRHSQLYKRTGEMAQRLEYLRVPMTLEQEDSIVGIIKEISPEPITPPMHPATKADWEDYRRRRELEDRAVLQRGQKVLNPEQLRALAELFEEKLAPVTALEQAAPAS